MLNYLLFLTPVNHFYIVSTYRSTFSPWILACLQKAVYCTHISYLGLKMLLLFFCAAPAISPHRLLTQEILLIVVANYTVYCAFLRLGRYGMQIHKYVAKSVVHIPSLTLKCFRYLNEIQMKIF